MGRLDEAEAFYRRAITAWEQAAGPGAPDLGDTLADYAGLLRQRGELQQAQLVDSRARAVLEPR